MNKNDDLIPINCIINTNKNLLLVLENTKNHSVLQCLKEFLPTNWTEEEICTFNSSQYKRNWSGKYFIRTKFINFIFGIKTK